MPWLQARSPVGVVRRQPIDDCHHWCFYLYLPLPSSLLNKNVFFFSKKNYLLDLWWTVNTFYHFDLMGSRTSKSKSTQKLLWSLAQPINSRHQLMKLKFLPFLFTPFSLQECILLHLSWFDHSQNIHWKETDLSLEVAQGTAPCWIGRVAVIRTFWLEHHLGIYLHSLFIVM